MRKLAVISGMVTVVSIVALAGSAFAGDAAKGELVFKAKCVACHGTGGDAGNAGGMKTAGNFANLDANQPRIKDLLANLTEEDHKKIVTNGGAKSGVKGAGAAMPKLALTPTEIDDVVAYERSLPALQTAVKKYGK